MTTSFDNFIESIFAWIRRPIDPALPVDLLHPPVVAVLGTHEEVARMIEAAPLFRLSDPEGMSDLLAQYREDLVEDLSGGLLAPFPSVAVAYEGATGWNLDWIHRLGPGERGERHLLIGFADATRVPGFPNAIEFEYGGGSGGNFLVHLSPDTVRRYLFADRKRPQDLVLAEVGKLVSDAMFRIAMISHPVNFLVEKTPALSPREARRMAAGKPRPIKKRPHFIVVDHQGLSELRAEQHGGLEASTQIAPHARRGHWMRLSERCQHARAAGKTRTWVRETFVGEREFTSPSGTQYRVLLSAKELPMEAPRAAEASATPRRNP